MNEQLPVAQLESLKHRANQIMESILILQSLIDKNGAPVMTPWPEVLARYNILLSQTHSLSVSLSGVLTHHHQLQPGQPPPPNPFQKLALHPNASLPEQQLDHALAPLLRNQPTIPVLKAEDASVRRIASVLKSATPDGVPAVPGPEGYEQVVRECSEIREEHDAKVERAVKAIALLRERYDWHIRVDPAEEDHMDDEEADLEDNGDITMAAPAPEIGVVSNHRTSEGSTPASSHSDEVNEARVTQDVLGETGPTPG